MPSRQPRRFLQRLARVAFALLFAVALFPAQTGAVEIPPTGAVVYLQTNGPANPVNNGDWYTSSVAGGGNGYHYIEIDIPCGWPAATPIAIDLFSPEINTSVPPGTSEEVIAPSDTTEFELYPAGTVIGPGFNLPAPGTGIAGTRTSYTPSAAAESWVRYATLAAPVACGGYVVRSQTQTDDQNAWRLRVGLDNDADPNNAPPANYDNPDGVPGTNDEVVIGVTQTSYQHDAGANVCLTLYEYVDPSQAAVTFNNFDMDTNVSVQYIAPSGAAFAGTVSTNSVWNGGSLGTRAGDLLANPESGWWQIITCTNNHNQFIQEGQTSAPSYYAQPPTPRMEISKTAGSATTGPNESLSYTIGFANTSNTTATPGAATNVTLQDTLPANATYVGCAIVAPYTGTCSQAAGVVTFALTESVIAGASGTVQVTVQVNADATGSVDNTATLSYEDGFGNTFPPLNANTTTPIPPLAISLLSFEASAVNNGVRVTWQTGAEEGTWGFHLLRSADGSRAHAQRVTTRPILAEGRGGGARYSWDDTTAASGVAYSYWLQEITLGGQTAEYGPVKVQSAPSAAQHRVFVPFVGR